MHVILEVVFADTVAAIVASIQGDTCEISGGSPRFASAKREAVGLQRPQVADQICVKAALKKVHELHAIVMATNLTSIKMLQ